MYPDHKCRSRQKKNRRSGRKKVKNTTFITTPIPRGKAAGHPNYTKNPNSRSYDVGRDTYSKSQRNIYN